MGAYILRRMLLMIPTMIGIMAISFVVVQFAPGGPVEQVIAQLHRQRRLGDRAHLRAAAAISPAPPPASSRAATQIASKYRGAQGLDPEFIKSSRSSSASTSRRSSASA